MSGNEDELPDDLYDLPLGSLDLPLGSLTGSDGLLVQRQLFRRVGSWLRIDKDYGQRHSLLSDVVKHAWDYALETNATVYELENQILPLGTNVIQKLGHGLGENLGGHEGWKIRRRRLDDPEDLWVHKDRPDLHVREGQTPYMDRYSIEEAAQAYLDMPYRVPSVERVLVDMLIAMEAYAFMEEAIGKKAKIRANAQKEFPNSNRPLDHSVYAEHPGRPNIRIVGYVAVVLFTVALGVWFFAEKYVPPHISFWGSVAAVVFGVFFLLLWIGGLGYVSGQEKIRNEIVHRTIRSMLHVYAEMGRGGSINTSRLREMALDAEQYGVDWPPLLYALLDDNLQRHGHI